MREDVVTASWTRRHRVGSEPPVYLPKVTSSQDGETVEVVHLQPVVTAARENTNIQSLEKSLRRTLMEFRSVLYYEYFRKWREKNMETETQSVSTHCAVGRIDGCLSGFGLLFSPGDCFIIPAEKHKTRRQPQRSASYNILYHQSIWLSHQRRASDVLPAAMWRSARLIFREVQTHDSRFSEKNRNKEKDKLFVNHTENFL